MSRTGWYPPSTHPNAGYATVVVPPVCRTIAGATLPDADSTDSRLDSQGIAQDIIWLPHDVPGVQPSIKPSDQVLSIARCQGMGDSRRAILTERGPLGMSIPEQVPPPSFDCRFVEPREDDDVIRCLLLVADVVSVCPASYGGDRVDLIDTRDLRASPGALWPPANVDLSRRRPPVDSHRGMPPGHRCSAKVPDVYGNHDMAPVAIGVARVSPVRFHKFSAASSRSLSRWTGIELPPVVAVFAGHS